MKPDGASALALDSFTASSGELRLRVSMVTELLADILWHWILTEKVVFERSLILRDFVFVLPADFQLFSIATFVRNFIASPGNEEKALLE